MPPAGRPGTAILETRAAQAAAKGASNVVKEPGPPVDAISIRSAVGFPMDGPLPAKTSVNRARSSGDAPGAPSAIAGPTASGPFVGNASTALRNLVTDTSYGQPYPAQPDYRPLAAEPLGGRRRGVNRGRLRAPSIPATRSPGQSRAPRSARPPPRRQRLHRPSDLEDHAP